MSVANTLKTPIVAPAITIQYAGAGGGPTPGLFLPLAGGTMDASPAGVINAHTITGLTTLESDANGNDLLILTQPFVGPGSGGDINLDATLSSGDVNIDANAITIESSPTAPNGLIINAITDIQPPAGYTYPSNPEEGLKVRNFVNPNTAADQTGILVDNISADNEAVGITLNAINSVNGNTTGVYVRSPIGLQDVRGLYVDNVAGNNVWGAEFNNLTSTTGDARGVLVSGSQGTTSAVGVEINSTTAVAGTAYGILMNGVNSDPISQATGIEIGNVSAGANAVGLNASSINSTNARAYGLLTTSINPAPANNGYGLSIISVNTSANGFARGIEVNQINAAGTGSRVFGADITSITGGGPAVGMNINSVSTTGTGNAIGEGIANITANSGTATGSSINTIQAVRAVGVDIANIVGSTSSAHGIRVQGARTTTSGPAYGGLFARAAKPAGAAGQLLKLSDGNLGLAVQEMNTTPALVNSDGGNYVVIKATAAATITLQEPTGGWEPGTFFRITKESVGSYNIADSNPANSFNAQLAGTPYVYSGAAYNKMECFFYSGRWYANTY